MPMPMQSRNAAEKNAQSYFKRQEQKSDTLGTQLRKNERQASATKTARLRDLRLAKEAAEKEAAGTLEPTAPAPRAKRAVVRMSY